MLIKNLYLKWHQFTISLCYVCLITDEDQQMVRPQSVYYRLNAMKIQ